MSKQVVDSPPEALEVWLDDAILGPVTHVGRVHRVKGNTVRFEYSDTWRRHPLAFALDPDLTLHEGDFYPRDSYFGIILDSCPDRWGQTLMKRREIVEAKLAGRARRELTFWDFFLGVQDVSRMGALRFSPLQSERDIKAGQIPDFNSSACLANELYAAPAMTHINELQAVVLQLTRKDVDDLNLLQQWLRVLVAPGASLGGARPKANLQDGNGMWIAKFPGADDDHDWALREYLVHQLADAYGITVSPSYVTRIGNGYHTFVTKRFDRMDGRRRCFTSAMALLGKTEKDESSYLDMAEFLAKHGEEGHIRQDLHEMFRRVLFNVATSNRDDHLRNHGFLRFPGGWRPAPAYDMNPTSKHEGHVLFIDDHDPMPSIDTVMETAEFYQVDYQTAARELDQLRAVLATWEARAKHMCLSAEDRAELESCFLL